MKRYSSKLISWLTTSYLYRMIFGYDVFISYARRDGLDYSYKVSQRLIKKKYECYIDQLSSITPGNELPKSIKNAVLTSKALIIIGSEGSGESEAIKQEILLFLNHRKKNPIIPISFDESIFKAKWYNEISGLPIVEEKQQNLINGNPSDAVIAKLENALDFTKKSKQLRNISSVIIALTLILIGLSTYLLNKTNTISENLDKNNKLLEVSKDSLELAVTLRKDAENKLSETNESLAETNLRLETLTLNLNITKTSLTNSLNELEQRKDDLAKVNTQVNNQKYELEFLTTIKTFRAGKTYLENGNIDQAIQSFDESIKEFQRLGKNPIIGLHARMATSLKDLITEHIASVPLGATTSTIVSNNDEQLFVTYDHQDPGGNPDLEEIPDAPAFEIFNLKTGVLIDSEPISSELGSEIYGSYIGKIIAFEESGHLIYDISENRDQSTLVRYSLNDGRTDTLSTNELSFYNSYDKRNIKLNTNYNENLSFFFEDSNLFEDGTTLGYGPRLVEQVIANSPEGRTTVAGTFTGKIILFDNATGTHRGIERGEPVFDATYSSDSKMAYVTDRTGIWKIDATGWSNVDEFHIPNYKFTTIAEEMILDLHMSSDDSLIAIATSNRIFLYNLNAKKWFNWVLPNKIHDCAGLSFDKRQKAINLIDGNGIIYSVNYNNPESEVISIKLFHADCEVVAYINEQESYALLACKELNSDQAEITKINLRTHDRIKEYNFQISDSSNTFDIPLVLHSIVEQSNQLAIFYGDEKSYQEDFPIMDEQVLFVSMSSLKPNNHFTLYSATETLDPPVVAYEVPHIESAIPTEGHFDIIAKHNSDGYLLIEDSSSTMVAIEANIFAKYLSYDKNDEYIISVNNPSESSIVNLNVRNLKRELDFTYSLPWPYERMPKFGTICSKGHSIFLANQEGEILYYDITKWLIPIK